ncbi:LarC family nickel insertion protein [Caldibacillus lycopersici]|uniref:LarC family nickel insertion protein n=1 Tax=Perspicuibacillus lycopersici TaxID=1325689 RepID=A0AAE3LPP9_9BACI|nr:LarC family nickel insertion protein [Perspicuibacillus lycopersici]MCU9615191.1 LarC family nickel insertion protein [Perspicuibacillus lycopersici]
MTILYLDCFSGISGDMMIGALLDAGGDFSYLEKELKKLQIMDEYRLSVMKVVKNGISSTKFDVELLSEEFVHAKDKAHTHHSHAHDHEEQTLLHKHPHSHEDHELIHEHAHSHGEHIPIHEHRYSHVGHTHSHNHDHSHEEHKNGHAHNADQKDIHTEAVHHHHHHEHKHTHDHHHHHGHIHDHHRAYLDIVNMIEAAALSDNVKAIAINIFKKIGEAEGKIHGVPLEKVHFHEVGAVDSIIDIVGTAILIDYLRIDEIISAPIPVGSGKIHIDHGIYPVPAPATLEILLGVPIVQSEIKGELTTPTGAAIAAVLATKFSTMPSMQVQSIGYGAGMKTFPEHPNVLRVVIGK